MHEIIHSDQTACAVHDLRASRIPTLTIGARPNAKAPVSGAPNFALHDVCMSVGVDPNFEASTAEASAALLEHPRLCSREAARRAMVARLMAA